jgi:hypothetical protein
MLVQVSQVVDFANNMPEITKVSLCYVEKAFFQVVMKGTLYHG